MRTLTTALGAIIGALGGALGYGILKEETPAFKNDDGTAAVVCIVAGAVAGSAAGHTRPRRKRAS